MLIDTSGSMDGEKIRNLKVAANQFIEQMGNKDQLTLLTFESEITFLVENANVGDSRDFLKQLINQLDTGGNTSLYDAIGEGGSFLSNANSNQYTNVMIVLTDGDDTASNNYRLNTDLFEIATSNDTTIFAIAYGNNAEIEVMEELALRGNGNFYLGTETNIAAIYDEMSAAFGGSAGIGR
jgi:Ca-activated chloride channel family protein